MTEKRTRTAKPRSVDEQGQPIPYAREFKQRKPMSKQQEKLKALLILACPPEKGTGAKSVPLLAKKIEVSKQALGHAMSKTTVTPGLAQKIVDAADGRVTLSDLSPFIFT